MEGWKEGRVERWKGGRVEGWKDGRMEGWKGGRVEGWKGGRVEGWKGGRVEGWKGGRVEGWKGGRVEGWKGGRVERWKGAKFSRKLGWLFLTWRAAVPRSRRTNKRSTLGPCLVAAKQSSHRPARRRGTGGALQVPIKAPMVISDHLFTGGDGLRPVPWSLDIYSFVFRDSAPKAPIKIA